MSNTASVVYAQRYGYLDGLRGMAAILVVFHHIELRHGGVLWAGNGFLAVDFFFILSGLVLSSAYENRLGNDLSLYDFTKKRIERLFPMAIIGTILGTVYLLFRWHMDKSRSDPVLMLLAASTLNLLLLPKFWTGIFTHEETFPANGPLWSLFFEFFTNLIWAALLPRASTRVLVFIILLGGAAFIACAIINNSAQMGWSVSTIWGGFGRVSFGFMSGVLLFRYRDRMSINLPIVPYITLIILLFFVFAPISGYVFPLIGALIGMPLAVAFGISAGQRSILPGQDFLGRISYPLYAVHMPILMFAVSMQKRILPHIALGAWILILIVGMVMIAYFLLIFYDEPVRKYLSERNKTSSATHLRDVEIR